MQFSIIDDDGFKRYADLDEVKRALAITPPDVLLHDDFTALSIEDGQAPTIGAQYADSFVGWKTRRLKNPPNLDQGVKRAVPEVTHVITDRGLHLRAWESSQVETGYIAGMISTERSLHMTPGVKITIPTTFNIGPGIHFTHWLMPTDGSVDVEFDIVEVIGSNRHKPNGPIDALFFNAKTSSGESNWKQHNVRPGFLSERHEYGFIWQRDRLQWLLDGNVVHEAPNLYHKPMYLMSTLEVGASSNGDFPGPINESTAWPAEAVLHSLRVERV